MSAGTTLVDLSGLPEHREAAEYRHLKPLSSFSLPPSPYIFSLFALMLSPRGRVMLVDIPAVFECRHQLQLLGSWTPEAREIWAEAAACVRESAEAAGAWSYSVETLRHAELEARADG